MEAESKYGVSAIPSDEYIFIRLRLYPMVVKPTITYESLFWWPKLKQAATFKEQNFENISFTYFNNGSYKALDKPKISQYVGDYSQII